MRLLFILYAIVAIVLIVGASRNKPSNKPSEPSNNPSNKPIKTRRFARR